MSHGSKVQPPMPARISPDVVIGFSYAEIGRSSKTRASREAAADIPAAQGEANTVQFLTSSIATWDDQPSFVLDKLYRDFGGILALVDQLNGLAAHFRLRFLKSGDHREGSGV